MKRNQLPKYDVKNDKKLLKLVEYQQNKIYERLQNEIQQNNEKQQEHDQDFYDNQINWLIIGKKLNTHAINVKHRYFYLKNNLTYDEEDQLVNLVTQYYDHNQTPDYDVISQKLRNLNPKYLEKMYFKIMRQYWDDEKTQKLLDLIKNYKDKDIKIDWTEISKQLDGRPIKVLQDWYSEVKSKQQ